MAKIGLNNFRYSVATEAANGALTYAGATKPAKAVSFSFTPTYNDAKLYADDALAESDTAVTGGTCTIGIDKLDAATYAALLGQTAGTGDEVISNANNVAPYVGLGRIVRLMESGTQKYRVTFFAKVKFSEPSESDTTRGESAQFNTYELNGIVAIPVDGNWRKMKTFDTQEAAVTYLEGLMAAPTP